MTAVLRNWHALSRAHCIFMSGEEGNCQPDGTNNYTRVRSALAKEPGIDSHSRKGIVCAGLTKACVIFRCGCEATTSTAHLIEYRLVRFSNSKSCRIMGTSMMPQYVPSWNCDVKPAIGRPASEDRACRWSNIPTRSHHRDNYTTPNDPPTTILLKWKKNCAIQALSLMNGPLTARPMGGSGKQRVSAGDVLSVPPKRMLHPAG
jgi:hypothetical protein